MRGIMREFIITEELANKLLNYIVAKPYIEVFQLVQQLQTLKPVEVKPEVVKGE